MTTNNTTFTVADSDAGQRIDVVIASQLAVSRSQVQQWIGDGLVQVNQAATKKNYRAQSGDTVLVEFTAPEAEQTVDWELDIMFEDDACIVVNKAVGALVHPAPGSNEPTIASRLAERLPELHTVGDSPERPGIVHRLDRLVSGVMVVAKTPEAFAHLKQQFQDRSVNKLYRAIVHGVPDKAGVIKLVIARSSQNPGRMAARPEHEEGKAAWTEYELLRDKDERYAELAVTIKTGRTHQIRAHLAAIDHPVVGDTLYTSKKYQSKRDYPRLFLHAEQLDFVHPVSGEQMSFSAPIPQEFIDFMQ